jgi:hypothetical protein
MALEIDLLRHKRRAGVTKIALLSFAILVAGCSSPAERLVQQYERNDSICKKSHVYGTGSYWNCRATRDRMVMLQQQLLNTSVQALLAVCTYFPHRDEILTVLERRTDKMKKRLS